MTPTEVRASARSGFPPPKQPQRSSSRPSRMFADCLQSF
jgi:hypothetical protein